MIRWGPVILVAVACGGPPKAMCTPRDEGGEFCVPDSGRAANIDVKLQLRDGCGSACDKGVVSCEVRVDAGTIVLALVGEACFEPNTACPAICAIENFGCALPPLPDGTYTVSSAGHGSAQLVVGAGGSPSCMLP